MRRWYLFSMLRGRVVAKIMQRLPEAIVEIYPGEDCVRLMIELLGQPRTHEDRWRNACNAIAEIIAEADYDVILADTQELICQD